MPSWLLPDHRVTAYPTGYITTTRRRTTFTMTIRSFRLTSYGERSQFALDRARKCRLSGAHSGRVARWRRGRRAIMANPAFADPGGVQSGAKSGCRVVPARRETRHVDTPVRWSRPVAAFAARTAAPRRAGSPGRRDRRALGAPRGGDGPPARAHPRVRRPRGLEQRVPLLRRVARAGASGSTWARPASASAWRAPSGRCRALAEALARGELSYAKVRALTRIATPETEARLLAVGRAGTAAHVERIVRGWRRRGPAGRSA